MKRHPAKRSPSADDAWDRHMAHMRQLSDAVYADSEGKFLPSSYSYGDLLVWSEQKNLRKLRAGDASLTMTGPNGMKVDVTRDMLRLIEIGETEEWRQSDTYITQEELCDTSPSNFRTTAYDEARKIGQSIHDRFGLPGMQAAYETVKRFMGVGAASDLDSVWNGVGIWRT
jgi:hypothetical protein